MAQIQIRIVKPGREEVCKRLNPPCTVDEALEAIKVTGELQTDEGTMFRRAETLSAGQYILHTEVSAGTVAPSRAEDKGIAKASSPDQDATARLSDLISKAERREQETQIYEAIELRKRQQADSSNLKKLASNSDKTLEALSHLIRKCSLAAKGKSEQTECNGEDPHHNPSRVSNRSEEVEPRAESSSNRPSDLDTLSGPSNGTGANPDDLESPRGIRNR